MVNTRKSSLPTTEITGVPNNPTTEAMDNTSVDSADSETASLLESLSPESKVLVRVLTAMLSTIISSKFSDSLTTLKKEIAEKDEQIDKLTTEVVNMKDKVQELETRIDNVDQYERRDTIILSGSVLPNETTSENTTSVVLNTFKEHLKINMKETDISVSHRLGSGKQQRQRPIIVKLSNRSLKYDLVGACMRLKPNLFINESLTPNHKHLLNILLGIRKAHRAKFQQLYTKEGTIIVKLHNSTVKHNITNEKTLLSFLEKYPIMMDTYNQSLLSTK